VSREFRCGGDGEPSYVEAPATTDAQLQAVLQAIVTRLVTLQTPQGSQPREATLAASARTQWWSKATPLSSTA
jgi:hypothetical protein